MQIPDQATTAPEGKFPFCEARGFRAMVFDWDGVLVDSGANYYRAYEMVLREAGIRTHLREIYLREGEPTGQLLATIFKQHGHEVDGATIDEMVDRRRRYDFALGEKKFFDGIWDLVHRLRRADLRIGMVTGSSRRSVERVLTADLAALFDVIITADDVVRPKPDAEPFLLAAKKLRVPPAHCLVIENAPFGIRGARAAGCAVVGLCSTLQPDDLGEANWIVLNHRELEALLSSPDLPDPETGKA
jgi:beta-phosphoglucomutase